MSSHKLLNLGLLFVMVASLVLGGAIQAGAQPPSPKFDQMQAMQGPKPPNNHGHPNGQMRTTTQAERTAARLNQPAQTKGVTATYAGVNPATASLSTLAPVSALAPSAATATMADAYSPPDYFGIANWANSPLPTLTPVDQIIGNPTIARAYASDFATPPGTLGPVFVVLKAALPAGTLQNFLTWNQVSGGSSTTSAGNLFHAYLLRPTGTANQYTVVFDTGELTVPAVGGDQLQTWSVTPTAVQAGDVIAFYGEGIPVDVSGGSDILSYPAPTAPAQGNTITLGVDPGFPIYSQDRTYSFAATVSATTNVLSGGMRKFIDGLPPLCPLGTTNDLGQCLPVADNTATPWTGAMAADYYEIGLVEFYQQMSSDLPPTKIRGYVQIVPSTYPGAVALTTANGLTMDIMDSAGKQVYGATRPQYLGPTIIAKGCNPAATIGNCDPTPVRVKFTNFLPAGSGGDLFIPTDLTYMGAGMGPQGVIARIDLTAGGTGYTSVPAVTIAKPGAGGIQATAVATKAGGVVTGVIVTNEGSGYAAGTHPAVTFSGGGGTGAAATAQVPSAGDMYTQNRSSLHLHGGNTPWISDGTPHQWITPGGEQANTDYTEGLSQRNVPDMWFDASTHAPVDACAGLTICTVPNATNDPGPGSETLYWTNQQGGRLMFFHDHAYGTTRLDVYVGEAAGYLISDPAEETQLAAATVPGTITDPEHPTNLAANDVTHMVPLIIQDKTFVPDDGQSGGQLAATDPTWPSPANPYTAASGATYSWGKGSLWFPHVYIPNQNPADMTGANAFGRWDYGPWFWPPQDPSTFVPSGQPYACDSAAYPGGAGLAFPPLYCPGTPNPSGTPEAFMDTMTVNGTAFPTLTVDPAAYRFQILSVGNDRALNLGLYVADPLAVAVTAGGSGYDPLSPPSVSFNPATGSPSATAEVSLGQVTSVLVTGVGAGYTGATPSVTIDPPGCAINGTTCVQATATAVISPIVGQVTAINVTNTGAGYTSVPNVTVQDPIALGCQTGCTQASAEAQITPAGTILGITVTGSGGPWTTAPAVSIAAPPTGGTQAYAIASVNSEVKMVDAVPPSASTTLPLCNVTTQLSGGDAGGLALAALDGSGNPLNGTGLPANCYPTSWPTDGRDGGVPDPTTAGPPIIQIGTEGGLLPSPAVIPSTPIGYEYNRRSITVLNVFGHGLLLGPAERADVVVDFSQFAGKTLLLYNDGPAPIPAFDTRLDYYTGDPDQTMSGGAPSTMPGYGPNTRTVMQIKVNATGTPNGFSLDSLTAALPNIFASTQDRIIVPEPAFPAGNGGAANPTYVKIQDTSISAWLSGVPVGGLTLTAGGSGYTGVPAVQINGGGGSGATATATLKPTTVASFSVGSGGAGYTAAPLVTVSGGGGTGAVGTAVLATAGSVRSITVTNTGSGYVTAPTVTIAAPSCTINGTTCVQATATVTVRTNGQRNITSITLTNPGAGYMAAPGVTFSSGTAAATTTLGMSVASITRSAAGSGYTSAPSVTIAAPPTCTSSNTTACAPRTTATGSANLTPTSVASLTLTNGGTGYTSAPTVQFVNAPLDTTGSGAAAIAFASTPLYPKAIQELFTLDYGRMNATLGVEVPFTNFLTQTTIPYGYVDPPTEIFKDGQIQFWKITHNGVDTHFIHFHLFDVQVINRVGWDGMVKPPDPNEVGWKDTVRMNPLEDIIVALRPLSQKLPWQLPNSIRPLDTTEAPGTALANEFTNVDPTNQPATVTNDMTNFGYEYVWHCHILGHEENDMMRAMVFAVPPVPPTITSATGAGGTLIFTDNSLNETGFTIQTAPSAAGPWTTAATLPAVNGAGNIVTYKNAKVIKTGMLVQVIANNLVGYTKTYAAPAVGYPTMDAPSAPATATVN